MSVGPWFSEQSSLTYSHILSVKLVTEKVTEPIRQIRTRDMSNERGMVRDLPNSSLDTAKSCLPEELELIFSKKNHLLAV